MSFTAATLSTGMLRSLLQSYGPWVTLYQNLRVGLHQTSAPLPYKRQSCLWSPLPGSAKGKMCITHINWIIFCFERKDAMKSSSSQLCPTPKKSSREVEEPKDRWDESVGLLTLKLCVRERTGGFKESGSLLQRFSTATLLCDNETTVTEESCSVLTQKPSAEWKKLLFPSFRAALSHKHMLQIYLSLALSEDIELQLCCHSD